MNEAGAAGPAPAAAWVEAGALLRQAREAAGLHVAALAVALKVPVGKLEALEAGRIDQLPDAVFARALVSSICRTLKIDQAPVLGHLPAGPAPRLKTDEQGINAPFRGPGSAASEPWWSVWNRPPALVALALLLGAAVLLLLPRLHWEETAVRVEAVLPPGASAPVPPREPGVAAADAVAPPPPVAAASDAAAPAGAMGSTAVPAGPAAAVSAAPSAAAAPAAGIVVFQPRQPTWVQVVDANGVVVVRKTLAAGETSAAGGALPLSVVVGRADVTDVQVRGKSFDLAPHARDNVARFEVR